MKFIVTLGHDGDYRSFEVTVDANTHEEAANKAGDKFRAIRAEDRALPEWAVHVSVLNVAAVLALA